MTYPLDVLRLRLAVETGHRTMTQVRLLNLIIFGNGKLDFHTSNRGISGSLRHAKRWRHCFFLQWLGPFSYWNSTIYCCELLHFWLVSLFFYWYPLFPLVMEDSISVCAVRFHRMTLFWLIRVKKSLPEKYKNRPETSLVTGLVSATLATVTCYPLDTIRRQMQMKGTPYRTVLDAFVGMYLILIANILWTHFLLGKCNTYSCYLIFLLHKYVLCGIILRYRCVTFCLLTSARNISQLEKVILEIKLQMCTR